MPKLRCIIVDDAAFMRATIRRMLEQDPEIEVIDTAGSGPVALNKISEQRPDVVTLDVEMPGMDGIEILRRIMAHTPTPVVMLSSHTQDGAQRTLDALEAGAVDYVGKPTGQGKKTLDGVAGALITKIKMATKANLGQLRKRSARPQTSRPTVNKSAPVRPAAQAGDPGLVVAIGISAGGPATLVDIFTQLPADTPAIVLTQHMPPGFTKSFADRLDRLSALTVKEAASGDVVRPGQALIAPGHAHMSIQRSGQQLKVRLKDSEPVCGHCPSVDVLFRSVAKACGQRCAGLIMTGMGNDGADAIGEIKALGAPTFAQNQESSVVYGMPKVAIDMGNIEHIVDLDQIIGILSGHIPVPA